MAVLSAVPVSSPTQLALPGPVDGTVTQVKYILPNIPDIVGHPSQATIEAALKNRVLDIHSDGLFRPASLVTRQDLAWALMLNSSVRQSLGSTPKFSDVSGNILNVAESVTAKGSTLRDYDFVPNGMIGFTGSMFQPFANINRLDLAVALVRALGHDGTARGLAGSTVTSGGVALSDNSQIPTALRGYVQLAIDKGIFEAFPAEVRQIAPGQFIVIPGPRFEPAANLNRADFAGRLNTYRGLFATGG